MYRNLMLACTVLLCLCLATPQSIQASNHRHDLGSLAEQSLPIILDGVEHAPGSLDDTTLEGLIFVIDRFSEADQAVYAFTSHDALDAYLRVAHGQRLVGSGRSEGTFADVEVMSSICVEENVPLRGEGTGALTSCEPLPPPPPPPPPPDPGPCYDTIAYFYEHVDYGGSNMTVITGQSITFGGSWWNDRISSVRSAGQWTILYKDHYWGGTELWLEGCRSIRSIHVSPYYFGDRASSIRVLQ